ncbi:dihydrofolate reductase family protein [Planctomycetota bacterium]
MRRLIYDVAITLDGYICHEDGSIDGFVPEGEHVADYMDRLKSYDAVLMGRNTYEFGYRYGLKPGDKPYEHMDNIVFSDSLKFDSAQVRVVGQDELDVVHDLKQSEGGDIYLCGGGVLAGTLLENALIDQLIIKLNPIVFGDGTKLFGNSTKGVPLELVESKSYESGVTLNRYNVIQP